MSLPGRAAIGCANRLPLLREDLPIFSDHGACLDRQLHRGKAQGLAGDVFTDTVDFEHHATGLHFAGPEVDRTLTFTHTHFDGLGGLRHEVPMNMAEEDERISVSFNYGWG